MRELRVVDGDGEGVKGVVGRSKKRVRVASEGVDHVWETVTVRGRGGGDDEYDDASGAMNTSTSSGGVLRYQQVEGAFSNPNGDVAEITAEWLYATIGDIRRLRSAAARGENDEDDDAPPPSTPPPSPSTPPPPLLPSLMELYSGNGRGRGPFTPPTRSSRLNLTRLKKSRLIFCRD